MAYNVEFTRQAEKELRDILQDINESGRRSFQRAFQALQTNPYPTNPEVSPGTIRRLRGSNEWRFRAGNYRIRYTVQGNRVIVDRVRHRKDIYRD